MFLHHKPERVDGCVQQIICNWIVDHASENAKSII